MRQNADLSRNLVALADLVEQAQQGHHGGHVVGGRIHADDRVAVAVGEAVEHAGRDAAQVVGGMVGLEPRGDATGQPDGGAESGHHAAPGRGRDQVLKAHQLGDGGDHFGGQAGSQGGEPLTGRFLGEQPVAEFAGREVRDGGEGSGIVRIADQARDLVAVVIDQRLSEKAFERQVGQLHAGAHTFFGGGGGDAGEFVARARGGGFCQQLPEAHTDSRSRRCARADSSSGASTRPRRPWTA